MVAVDDLTTCKEAAEVLGHRFKFSEEEAGWPKGCYAVAVGSRNVYFNQHIDGSKNYLARQICESIGKGSHSFLTSMHLLS